MRQARGLFAPSRSLLALIAIASPSAAADGQAVHVSLAPKWFDPAETPGIIAPFMILDALHAAVVTPVPGNPMASSLAESWTAWPDRLVDEFVLRKGARLHNGDPVTAEDVTLPGRPGPKPELT